MVLDHVRADLLAGRLSNTFAQRLAGAYFYIEKSRTEALDNEFRRYGGAIAETSVAARLYQDNPDSFLIARDSILHKYSLTQRDMLEYRNRFKGDERRWADFWDYVVEVTDSLTAHYDSLAVAGDGSR